MADTEQDWKPSDVDDPLPFDPAPEPFVFDRTPAERYAKCPFQGWAVESGLVTDTGFEADSGNEAHRIVAEMIGAHIDAGAGREGYSAMIEWARAEIPKARPDVQQDVAKNLWPSVYGLARMITYAVLPEQGFAGEFRNPNDILRWQGGEGERSGQITAELIKASSTRGAVLVTSEVDLLLASESRTELTEIDFKRFKVYTASDIKASFQFRCHAWLLFNNYPELQQLRTAVWNLPINTTTTWAVFTRRDVENIQGVLLRAYEARQTITAMIGDGTSLAINEWAWPHPDKCMVCPAILDCPRAATPAHRLNDDPSTFAKDTELLEILVAERKKHLRTFVDKKGEIVMPDGRAYGLNKPATRSKPTATKYTFYDMPVEELPASDAADLGEGLGNLFDGKEPATDDTKT